MLIKKAIKAVLPYGAVRLYQKKIASAQQMDAVANFWWKRKPDFYVAGPHGAGLQSFIYYLNLIGLSSSSWWDANIMPVRKAEQNYAYGITYDSIPPNGAPHSAQRGKIFWLMRDPISILCACINESFAELITIQSVQDLRYLQVNLPAAVEKLLFSRKESYCTYTSLLKSVLSDEEVYPVDTEDLMPACSYETMKNITSWFSVPMPENIGDVLANVSNSAQNRYFRGIPSFIVERGEATIVLGVGVPYLYDFQYNHWKYTYIIDKVSIEGREYILYCTQDYRKIAGDSFTLTDEEFESLTFYISVYTKYADFAHKLYKQHVISKEALVDFFKQNVKYYDLLMALLDKELVMVQQIASSKMEKWKYYAMLIN